MSIIEDSKKARGFGFLKQKKKMTIVGIVIVVAVVGVSAYVLIKNKNNPQAQVQAKREYTVKKDDIRIAIESDGKVVAEDGVSLSFAVSGDNLEVKEVFVKEGDQVKKGDRIATVKTESLELSRRSAYSSYSSALASYNAKLEGPTDDEIYDSETAVEQAKVSLEQSKISLEKTKLSAEQKVANAENALKIAKANLDLNKSINSSEDVTNEYEDLVNTIKSINISLEDILHDSDEIVGVDKSFLNDAFENNLGAKSVSSLSAAKTSYVSARQEYNSLDSVTVGLSEYSNHADIDRAAVSAKAAMETMEDHLYDMRTMLDNTITSVNLTQSALDSFKSTISSNRTSVNTKISTLYTDVQAVATAKDDLGDYRDEYNDAVRDLEITKIEAVQDIANAETNITTRELALRQAEADHADLFAPLSESEMASARSSLTSASVSLEKSKMEMDKATIVSPIDGEVARLNYKAGDIIIDNSVVAAEIINNDTLFIEVDIEEAEINKIKNGQLAYATFDAVDDLRIGGEVSFISLTSKTSNNGIVTYQVRILIDNAEESQVREGMTAFVDFVTAEANDVLTVPVDAVRNVDGKPSVETASGEWAVVTTGFTDGKEVEVISGLSAGDIVLY